MPPKIRPPGDEEFTHADHDQCGGRQVGAERRKNLLEGRNHEDHDHGHHHEGHHHHRDRVHQRRLDLGLDGLGLFHVDGQAVQQLVQDTGGLTGFDQIAVKVVEVERVLAEGRAQRGAGFDIVADVIEQARHTRVGVAAAHDVKGLQQGHAGLHHGGQLAREQGQILGGDFLAGAHPPFLDLARQDALAAQRGHHLVFASGAHLAAHQLAIAILALPLEDLFLAAFGLCCCHAVP